MHKEGGERRDFLPALFAALARCADVDVVLEDGYGAAMGLAAADYRAVHPRLRFGSHDEAYGQDAIVVLRAPTEREIGLIRPGAILISMLHYETREARDRLLLAHGIRCFSMDALADDDGARLVVDYRGTAGSGVRVAFEQLARRMESFLDPVRRPLRATIVGLGRVAQNAAKALEELGDRVFLEQHPEVPGLFVQMLPRSLTKDRAAIGRLLGETDILVDASRRPDASQIIVPNALLRALPAHAVILDLCADPYDERVDPPQVKGIEGIPTGTLDRYVIETDDPLYEAIPDAIDSTERRLVVSCNAWPGVDPAASMAVYGKQLLPFLRLLLRKDAAALDAAADDPVERALARSSLDHFIAHHFAELFGPL